VTHSLGEVGEEIFAEAELFEVHEV